MVEERLHVYVEDRVEQLRAELRAELRADLQDLLESNVKKHESAEEARPAAGKTVSELPDDPFAAHHLDQQDAHELDSSIWDCVLLIGLDCIGLGESCVLVLLLVMNICTQLFFCLIVFRSDMSLDCIGLGESCMLVLLLVMNIWTQLFFCVIVFQSDMSEDPLTNDVLNELLRFRTRVAHKVEYADVVSGRSLISQVCNGDQQLPVAGLQRGMHEDFMSFDNHNTGRTLVLLALLCWGACVLAEINSTLRFAFAICQKRGKTTRITLYPEGGYLLESLSSGDVVKTITFNTLPRLLISAALFVVGTLYLGMTSRPEDLLLNAMALSFILQVDELFFAAFVPHRVKSLMRGLQPLLLKPLSSFRQRRFERVNRIFGGSIDALLRVLVLFVSICVIYVSLLHPFQVRMQQAADILCSGEKDFVYSVNPANGMVVAARSANSTEETWATEECAILKIAKPVLDQDLNWEPPLCDGKEVPVVYRPHEATSLEGVPEFDQSHFDYVSRLAREDVQDVTGDVVCDDQVGPPGEFSSANFLTALQEATRNETVLSCDDVKHLCHLQNMTRVRNLCPEACECNLWGFTRAGVFKTAHYGCPQQCKGQVVAEEESYWTDTGVYPLECVDFTNSRYFVGPTKILNTSHKLAMMDSDEDGNITALELSLAYMRHLIEKSFWDRLYEFDLNGDGLWDPSEQSSFAVVNEYFLRYDADLDDNLSVDEARSAGQALFSLYTDADGDALLTAAEMAGHPPGMSLVPSPVPKRITGARLESADRYLVSLFEYVESRPDFRQNLEEQVETLGELLGHTQAQRQRISEYFGTGQFVEDWPIGIWQLAPGIPHPRELVWCQYITSWEIVLLLGLGPCNHEGIATVRSFCPESCRCHAQMTDCPSSCPSIYKMQALIQ